MRFKYHQLKKYHETVTSSSCSISTMNIKKQQEAFIEISDTLR